jgi:hypothetical protein
MEDFNFSFPISFVKKEERIVVGIATADNIDKSNDVVDPDASIEAFKKWQGNIREMHAPIAVGKAISHRPIKVKGPDGQEYRAIQVEAYISKGAQSTWEKVLDGTLRAFSIGGKILKKEMMQGKMHNGRPVNFIKQYELGELSLVDNPANPMAVIDVVKFDTGSDNLDYILKIDCSDINLTIPESVKRVAQTGLNQRKEYGRGGTSVGLGSARRLAQGGVASPEFVRKVARYFPRHEVDLRANGANPGDKGYPSNGRIAWNLWGGTPGWAWARSKVRQLDNCTRKSYDGVSCSCSLGDGTSCWQEVEKANEVTTESMSSGIKKPQQGYKKKKKLKKSDIEQHIQDANDIFEAFDKPEIEELIIDMLENGGFDEFMDELEKSCGEATCSCGCSETSDDSGTVKYDHNSNTELQNDVEYDMVKPMDNSLTDSKLSLAKKFLNWFAPEMAADFEKSSVAENADSDQTESVVELEEDMDIDVLKEALGSVIDEKLNAFATSFKEEVEADIESKIGDVSKSFESQKTELTEKLEKTEQALAEQTEKLSEFAEAGAVKKSVDPEDDEDDDFEKSLSPSSFWGNIYLPEGLIKSLGYKS